MATKNVLPALVKIECGENREGQANALGFLVRLSDSFDIQTQRLLIQLCPILCLKQVLRFGTAEAKILSRKFLENISKSIAKLNRETHRWSFNLSRKTSVTCKLHKGKCSSNDCIVEAGVVPDIVEMLKDQNPEVALAGLKALDLLIVEEYMPEHGIQILDKCKSIDNLFQLNQSNSHACSEKCIDLFEVILRHSGMKNMYWKMVKMSLTALCTSRVSSLQQISVRLFRQLEEVVP
ncbi:hypothetical protein SUGI_0794020 [Cryptomeria japonica]|nr:hypothetical protein SUGI_0794020 [Cryptomeria japonica]